MSQPELVQRPVLVMGAGGTVGRHVVRSLLQRGAAMRLFVRRLESVESLPASVERFVGNLEDAEAVARAFDGIGSAFFVSPHEDTEELIARNVVGAAELARVRLVHVGVHADGSSRLVRLAGRLLFRVLLAHYSGKLLIAERVRTSRTDSVLILPGSYYQNEEIFRAQILAGVFPMPLRLIPRVDARDVGEAAGRALVDPSVAPGVYHLVAGADRGEQAAAAWGAALGHEVRYEPDFATVDEEVGRHYTGRKASDFRKSHRVLGKYAFEANLREVAQTTWLLGRSPRSHADYVRDTVAAWRPAAAA
jgi:uncharacterized protein YbjT (DUF2867 family)